MIKQFRLFLESRGYYVYKPVKVNGLAEFEIGPYSYGVNIPGANYAPWRNDTEFVKISKAIVGYTLVDVFRCYEIWQLVSEVIKQSPNLNFIEIGVWRGGTGLLIAKKMSLEKSNAKIYLADTFTGVVKTGKNDSFYKGGEHDDTSLELVTNLFKNQQLNNYEILQGIFPEETAHKLPDNIQFGLCHIDVDVYLSAKDCIDWIWDKMVVGGIVVFDDYGNCFCDGITKLVEEQRKLKDRVVIHNINGHGLIIKIK